MYDWSRVTCHLMTSMLRLPWDCATYRAAQSVKVGRAWRLSHEFALHSSDFDLESVLSLFLCYRADAQADANPEISLIDEPSAVREDSDAWCACRGHELLLCRVEEHSGKER